MERLCACLPELPHSATSSTDMPSRTDPCSLKILFKVLSSLCYFLTQNVRCCRAKYQFFPSMFNTGDLTWYPPDYRRAVVDETGGGSRGEECGEDTPLPTSIMMTAIDSPPRIAEQERRADRANGGGT